MASIYVHFPWCLAKCPYCDFVSYAVERDTIDHEGYADAIVRELALREAPATPVASLFFGGGTPSLWDPRALGRVIAAIGERLPLTADVEITAECNPSSLDASRARALADAGVNRLSIGTQSLRADALKWLGRLHDPGGALAALDAALSVPGLRVSADLIFGLPEQPPEDARDQALALADRGLLHVSCYQLTIEPGTAFGELARKGRLPRADDGRVAESFLAIDEALAGRGFRHYEISNYARPGEEARHNLAYWHGDEYLGLGCAAFGRVGGVRWRNVVEPARYVEATRRGLSAVTASREPLDAATLFRERIMLGLRLEEGFDLEAAAEQLGVEAWPKERARAAEQLVARGRLVRDGGRVRIPRAAWLFTDDTAARLF